MQEVKLGFQFPSWTWHLCSVAYNDYNFLEIIKDKPKKGENLKEVHKDGKNGLFIILLHNRKFMSKTKKINN